MNNDSFNDSLVRYVEQTRDCEQALLDIAVNKGLHRARNDRLDSRKIRMLVAACAFTVIMCFTVSLRPFNAAAEDYYRNRNSKMPGSAEVLDGYMKNIAGNFQKYFGGK